MIKIRRMGNGAFIVEVSSDGCGQCDRCSRIGVELSPFGRGGACICCACADDNLEETACQVVKATLRELQRSGLLFT